MPPRRHYPMDATETLSTDSLDKEYNYETDHFYLNLGPRRQEIKYPAYGLYGAVDGTVLVTKECSNILSVTVTLEGEMKNTASQGGNIVAGANKVLLSRSIDLLQSLNPIFSGGGSSSKPTPLTATLSEKDFCDFVFSFPAYIDDGTDRLPPSQSFSQQGALCNVSYTLKVDIIREGRSNKNESIKIQIMYLPRSTPPGGIRLGPIEQPFRDYEIRDALTVDLKKSRSARKALEKLQMSAKLTLPAPKRYPCGGSIPLWLELSSLKTPQLLALFGEKDSLSIYLIRRVKMSTYIGEAEVSKAKLKWSGNDTGAVCSTSWVLQLGQKEGRVSWKVADLVEVKYLVRIFLKLRNHPAFQYEEVVELTSDPWLKAEKKRLDPSLKLVPPGMIVKQSIPQNPRSSIVSSASTGR